MTDSVEIISAPLDHRRTTLGDLRDLVSATDDWPETTAVMLDHDGITVERVRS